jgi:hypothetical protein
MADQDDTSAGSAPRPDLTIDEPAVTGWTRFNYYGDTEAAQRYTYDGRMLSGQVRSGYGVNDRVAEGQGGGWYQGIRKFEDGTVIIAQTNDNHNVVHIWTPPTTPPEVVPVKEATPQEATPQEDFDVPLPQDDFTLPEEDFTPPEIDVPEPPPPPEIAIPAPPPVEFPEPPPPILPPELVPEPYLWIGVRQLTNRPTFGDEPTGVMLHCCLFEPNASTAQDGPMVLSNQNWWDAYWEAEGEDREKYPMPKNWIRTVVPDFDPRPWTMLYTNYGAYLTWRWSDKIPGTDIPWGINPLIYDPEPDPTNPIDWDFVFVLDPSQASVLDPGEEGLPPFTFNKYPTDDRTQNDKITPIIPMAAIEDETEHHALDRVLPPPNTGGVYSLKIMSSGDDCDMTPVDVLIEVRTLKGPLTTREQFRMTINECSDVLRGILPFGTKDESGECVDFNGPNPHREHWWQDAIVCSPWGGVKEVAGFVPPEGFEPGAHWPTHAQLCPDDEGGTQARYAYLDATSANFRSSFKLDVAPWDTVFGPTHPWTEYTWNFYLEDNYAGQKPFMAANVANFQLGGLHVLDPEREGAAAIQARMPASVLLWYITMGGGLAPFTTAPDVPGGWSGFLHLDGPGQDNQNYWGPALAWETSGVVYPDVGWQTTGGAGHGHTFSFGLENPFNYIVYYPHLKQWEVLEPNGHTDWADFGIGSNGTFQQRLMALGIDYVIFNQGFAGFFLYPVHEFPPGSSDC